MDDDLMLRQAPFNTTLDAATALRENISQVFPQVRNVARTLADAQPTPAVRASFAKAMYVLGAYIAEVVSLAETFDCLFRAVCAAIRYSGESLGPHLDAIAGAYELLIAHVDTLRAASASARDTLDAIEREIMSELAYDPVTHLVVFHVLSPLARLYDPGDYATAREAALRETPGALEHWRALIRANDEVVGVLESHAEEARSQFNVCTLVYIRGLADDERRTEVQSLVYRIGTDFGCAARMLRLQAQSMSIEASVLVR